VGDAEKIICDFFVRAASGAAALVVGTGLCYRLFVGGYLRSLEHYKERLRVYKALDRCGAEIIRKIGILKRNPQLVDQFSKAVVEFNEYVNGEDRLFMSAVLKAYCRGIIRTLEELMPDQYPEPSRTIEYPQDRLLNVDDQFRRLRRFIEEELEATRFGISPELIKRWSQIQRILSGQGKRRTATGANDD
jgi:hypothetical protein